MVLSVGVPFQLHPQKPRLRPRLSRGPSCAASQSPGNIVLEGSGTLIADVSLFTKGNVDVDSNISTLDVYGTITSLGSISADGGVFQLEYGMPTNPALLIDPIFAILSWQELPS